MVGKSVIKKFIKSINNRIVTDEQIRAFSKRVFLRELASFEEPVCTHKYHRSGRTPEECVALQKKHKLRHLKISAEKIIEGRLVGYACQLNNLINYLNNPDVCNGIRLIVSQEDPYTSEYWKKRNTKVCSVENIPFEIPEFGNSFSYECVLDD